MQHCNKYDDYFNCYEHCGEYTRCPSETAADDLPACMYASNDPGRELVNPWDMPASSEAPVSQVETLVPSGVTAWPPVRCAITVPADVRSAWSPATTNPSLFEGDLEFPAMPMMAQNSPNGQLSAFDLEYPAMPMMAHELTTTDQSSAIEFDSQEYPALPTTAEPLHGLVESVWTQTAEERRVSGTDTRLIPYDELEVDFGNVDSGRVRTTSSSSSLSSRLAGLGFRLSDKLELANSNGTTLNEYQIALAFQRAADARNSDSSTSDSDESDSLGTSIDDGPFDNIDIDDK